MLCVGNNYKYVLIKSTWITDTIFSQRKGSKFL